MTITTKGTTISHPHPTLSNANVQPTSTLFFPFSHQSTILICLLLAFLLVNGAFIRLVQILSRASPSKTKPRPRPSPQNPTHLLVVLGSGGHTAEMLNMLSQIASLRQKYTHRTYVVSSGDGFSALKASEFENRLTSKQDMTDDGDGEGNGTAEYDIVTVRRARRVHQSILTTPWSASLCVRDCISVLRGKQQQQQTNQPSKAYTYAYPDLILTNGPGTGVCVVFASIILLFLGMSGSGSSNSSSPATKQPLVNHQFEARGQMRTIFIESWARVKTLSLSGTILQPFVDRFLVQWPGLANMGGRVEYAGPFVG